MKDQKFRQDLLTGIFFRITKKIYIKENNKMIYNKMKVALERIITWVTCGKVKVTIDGLNAVARRAVLD